MGCYNIQSCDMKPKFACLGELAYAKMIRLISTRWSIQMITQAGSDGKQILTCDTCRKICKILGAVINSILVSKSEAHASLVCGRIGIWRGDEIFDGGTHVIR